MRRRILFVMTRSFLRFRVRIIFKFFCGNIRRLNDRNDEEIEYFLSMVTFDLIIGIDRTGDEGALLHL